MPTILRIGAYRFFFYAGDGEEPEHVHIERGNNIAKFWLSPVRLERSGGFNRSEILRIHQIVEQNRERLLEAWHDYFKG
jgi:hypothetical protein